MFDAHNHLHFAAFDSDREAVISRARQGGVRGMILAGYDSRRRELCAELGARSGIRATAGVHPWAVQELDDAGLQSELQLLHDLDWSQFVGLGELGLDRYIARSDGDLERQTLAFRTQLELARQLDLPLVIHSVRANQDILRWLEKDGVPGRGGLVHAFWGSAEEAQRFVDLGLHLSIGTQLTHSAPEKMRRALRRVGVDHLLVETDAPSRPPAQIDDERNEPAYLGCIVTALALTLGTDEEEVAVRTESNTRRLFQLPPEEELQ